MKYLENIEDFDKIIKGEKVLIDFFATWCGPCQMLSPVLEELANTRGNVEIVKVDIDKFGDIARKYGIMSVPTLMLFEKGENKKTEVGYMDKEKIEEFIY